MTVDGPIDQIQHRPTWAEIDLGAIRGNIEVLRAQAANSQVMAVVKADGYGHGAVHVARAALEAGATWLGVALVEEGARLRDAGVTAPILLLSEPPPESAVAVLRRALTPTVYTHAFSQALASAAEGLGIREPVDVHLKIDTGMRRVGLAHEHWEDGMRRLAATDRLRVSAVWTHFAVGDEPDSAFTRQQGERFQQGVEMARSVGLRPGLLHTCNSGGTTMYPEFHFDLVRAGIAVYGLEAAPGVKLPGLRPALALRTELSLVKQVSAGQTVSYGRRWAPDVDSVVGTIPVGYADGLRRGLTGRGEVIVGGTRRPLAGTVCMDMTLVDLGPTGGAGAPPAAGEPVWLIGGPGPDPVTAEDWAAWLGTITYEVTCGLGSRVPRRYIGA